LRPLTGFGQEHCDKAFFLVFDKEVLDLLIGLSESPDECMEYVFDQWILPYLIHEDFTVEDHQFRGFDRSSGGRSRASVDNGHLSEEISFFENCQRFLNIARRF
jgi:hypothetical protein